MPWKTLQVSRWTHTAESYENSYVKVQDVLVDSTGIHPGPEDSGRESLPRVESPRGQKPRDGPYSGTPRRSERRFDRTGGGNTRLRRPSARGCVLADLGGRGSARNSAGPPDPGKDIGHGILASQDEARSQDSDLAETRHLPQVPPEETHALDLPVTEGMPLGS